jgi:hypothetical protein
MLLFSITIVSGYEAVETFNRLKYKGRNDWELGASGVKFSGGTDRDLLTIQEAVEIAGLLRREEHVAQTSISVQAEFFPWSVCAARKTKPAMN